MKRGARERDGGGGEGKVSTRLTSATARYTGTKYRYNNAVQVRVPVRLSVPVHTSSVCWLLACLTSQQHASVPQGRICSDNFTCCHTEIEVADQAFHLTQSQYTDTGPTSPSADPITPGT